MRLLAPRRLRLVLPALLAPAALQAQASLPDLIGERVRVEQAGSDRSVVGVVESQDGGALGLSDPAGGAIAVDLDAVEGIERSLGHQSLVMRGLAVGTVSGLLVGGVGGALVAGAICGNSSCDANYGEAFLIMGGVGAVGGLVLGSIIGAVASGERWEEVPLGPGTDAGLFLDVGRRSDAALTVGLSVPF